MEERRFCVYNQTNECFLSLGVTAAETTMSQFKNPVGRQAQKYDEGLWLASSKGIHSFYRGANVPLDLIYLDRNSRVVHVVESFQKFRIAPVRRAAASVLVLPAHTIYSSQTKPGDQMVVCAAEEMKFVLGSTTGLEQRDESRQIPATINGTSGRGRLLPEGDPAERRRFPRHDHPRLIAHDWDGAELGVHGIRDASDGGLYLLTEKRWPLGALVWMTLQRTDKVKDGTETSITVQMKVMRWGKDGVGLQFFSPATLDSSEWVKEDQTSDETAELPMLHAGPGLMN